jgi:hypothetical protein
MSWGVYYLFQSLVIGFMIICLLVSFWTSSSEWLIISCFIGSMSSGVVIGFKAGEDLKKC